MFLFLINYGIREKVAVWQIDTRLRDKIVIHAEKL